jgi:hypothetical protein
MRVWLWLLLSAAWTTAVGFGLWNMVRYEMTPAAIAEVPENWPAGSALRHDADRPTLVLFVHPHCPCSRASLDELAVLVTHRGGKMSTTVVFLKPPGFDKGWEKTDLWRTAESIPETTVFCDEGGTETARFHARVSGETLLYDREGRLLFHGGLTPSRGHRGDSAGRSAVELLLAGEASPLRETPVFGCSLGERNCARAHFPHAMTP